MKRSIFLATLVLATGCSSFNDFLYKDKCKSGDWQGIGQRDGESGRTDSGGWAKNCSAYGVSPNTAQYAQGNSVGLEKFCFNKAFGEGKSGAAKNPTAVCSPAPLAAQTDKGYVAGVAAFCTPELGKAKGASGQLADVVCHSNPGYQGGYQAGVSEHCVATKAFAAGVNGTPYDIKICPATQAASLTLANSRGSKSKETKAKISVLESEIADLEKKYYDIATPVDAKGHYKTILATKKEELKASIKELGIMESMTQ